MSSPPPRFRDPLFVSAVVALGLVFWGLQLARGPATSVDELFCPTSAVLLEAGLPLRADLLVLKDFCGGCAVNTLAARGLFGVLPVQVWVWRLVPFAFGLGILFCAWRLGGLLGGRWGAATAAGLYVLSPPAYRHMAVRGFGNHVEVMALVLGAMVAVGLVHERGRRRDALLLGFLCGASLFYAYIAAFILPAVAAVWLARRRPTLPAHPFAVLGGALLGFCPWFLVRMLPPERTATYDVHGRTLPDLLGADIGVGERLGVLFGEHFWGNLFAPEFGMQPWLGALWIVPALAGVAAVTLAARRSLVARVLAAGVGFFLLEWLLLAPGLPTWPPVPRGGGDSIHYLVPLLTMLPIAAAALWGDGPLRRLAPPVTAALALLGGVGVAGDFVRDWQMTGMTSPAADHRPGAIQISAEVPTDPEQLSAADVDTVLGIRPGRLVARRAILASLGRRLPGEMDRWSHEERLALVRFVEGLPTGDERWLFWGISYDTVPRTDNPEPLPNALVRVLGPWPKSMQGRLLRQARHNPAEDSALSHPDGPQGRSQELHDQLGRARDPMVRAQVAWEIGVAAASQADLETGPDVGSTQQLRAALHALPALPAELLTPARWAIIDTIVEDRCADSADCTALGRALTEDRDAFTQAVCVHHLRCDD